MSKNYTLIGLTGTTGSGKSTVSRIFSEAGYAVVDADKIAHRALAEPRCIQLLTEAFGEDILSSDGSINRKALGGKAFSSKENTCLLNSITHPVIRELSLREFEELSKEGYSKILFDAPTLFESGTDKLCHRVVAVTASEAVRLRRIILRDSITEEAALLRIGAQQSSEFYTSKADLTIENNGDIEDLKGRTKEVIKELNL